MKKIALVVIVIVLFLFIGCSAFAGEIICGAERSRTAFYNLYEEGVAAESAGRIEEAICLYKASAEKDQKKGMKRRRVRTYGMHFIENYDPLGRVERLKKR